MLAKFLISNPKFLNFIKNSFSKILSSKNTPKFIKVFISKLMFKLIVGIMPGLFNAVSDFAQKNKLAAKDKTKIKSI